MTVDVLEKYMQLVKVNEKLTQLHWIVAQVAGENDLHTMHNLILNGFMQIAEVPGCYFILLDENGDPSVTVKRMANTSPFGSYNCTAYLNIRQRLQSIGNMAIPVPHAIFCEQCEEACDLAMLQVVTLYGKHGNPLAIIIAPYLQPPSNSEETTMILELFTIQVSLALENAMLNKKFENLSITDALTGLYNHRHFAERLQKETELCTYMHKEMCLIMLDVDNFKSYNDNFGHPAGDQVLRTMAKIFTQSTRTKDIVARYGGEEFALILPNTGLPEAVELAESIRQNIENTAFPHRAVTASLGIANYPEHSTNAQELLGLADKALYFAKSTGRNRVIVAPTANNAKYKGGCYL